MNIIKLLRVLHELFFFPLLIIFSLFSRFRKKNLYVGIGPEPLINNYHHKESLKYYKIPCETYVDSEVFITKKFDKKFFSSNKIINLLFRFFFVTYFYSLNKFTHLFIYFTGGSLYRTVFLYKFEPILYKLANLKIVVMPYGSDVFIFNKCKNLSYKRAVFKDYPDLINKQKKITDKIFLWSSYADHIISGCDWIDYVDKHNTLMLSYFSINLNNFKKSTKLNTSQKINLNCIKILHAPNHREIKGTKYIISAVNKLKKQGYKIDLKIMEKDTNENIIKAICESDIVIDQLIIGWYAMFAIEALAHGKFTMCYLRKDLLNFYHKMRLLDDGYPPFFNTSKNSLYNDLKYIIDNKIYTLPNKNYDFIKKNHSYKSVGKKFKKILDTM